jgi:hypothetical protein
MTQRTEPAEQTQPPEPTQPPEWIQPPESTGSADRTGSPAAPDCLRDRPRPGLLGRLAAKLTKSESELEAEELQHDTDRLGATPISSLADRQTANICGAVRSVTLRPRVNVPALLAELYDGSQALNLVWLGRRSIGGIEPGTFLRVHGRVTHCRGVPTIFNPVYEIVPGRGH